MLSHNPRRSQTSVVSSNSMTYTIRYHRIAIISSFLSILLLSCSDDPKIAPELVGTWENTFMMLETGGTPDMMAEDVFVADSSNWERRTGMKPVRTTFFADGTFKGEYRNLQDSVYVVAKGTWNVKGESLYYHQWEPDTFLATYWFKVEDDTATFKGLLDWERDGQRDDVYTGTQKRLK